MPRLIHRGSGSVAHVSEEAWDTLDPREWERVEEASASGPALSWTKAQLVAAADAAGVEVPASASKAQIMAALGRG